MRTAIDYAEVVAAYAQHRRVHPEVLRSLLAVVGHSSNALRDDWTHELPNDQVRRAEGTADG
jgi:hypothetical protein